MTVRIKICGVTTPAAAAAAAELGVEAVGLNFYPKSPRCVTPDQACELVRHLGPFVAPVGVFVTTDWQWVTATADEVGLRAVQTYSDQPPASSVIRGDSGTTPHPPTPQVSPTSPTRGEVEKKPPSSPPPLWGRSATETADDGWGVLSSDTVAHIPAFRVKDAADLDHIRRFVAACRPAAVLVDSFVAGEMGGTGHLAPWELLVGFDPGVPLILAGGLTPDNVADAIRLVRPYGVDVASGVESAPGVKDHGKLRAFVQAARGALE